MPYVLSAETTIVGAILHPLNIRVLEKRAYNCGSRPGLAILGAPSGNMLATK